MKLFAVASVLAVATPAFPYTKTYSLSYDITYDQTENSLRNVACSNGEHGLITRGYKTFDDLPTYPNVGGAPQILSWNSRYCGTCWELTYTGANGASVSLNFTAINIGHHDPDGFSISLEGMKSLTDGNAPRLDGVEITAARKPASWCGL